MQVNRDRAVEELEELAIAADEQKNARWNNFRRYSRLRNVFWILAAALAGTAGLLALGDASKTLTSAVAFAAAFSTALEGRITPAERRRRHQRASAEYRNIAWWARHRTESEVSGSDLNAELERLQAAKHRLDLEFGPEGMQRPGSGKQFRESGLERHMQVALRRNIAQLDPALQIVDEGKERRVEAGLIDVLAEDHERTRVVIELKSGEAPEAAITQLLSYVGSLQAEDNSRAARGMLIAQSFSPRVKLAARAAGIELGEYGFNFSFRLVGTDGGALGRPANSTPS